MSIYFSKLKIYRKQHNLTQEDLADRLGVSRQAIAKWERGETLPDIESCIKLADIYGTTVDMLVRDIGREEHTGDGKHVFGISKVNEKGQITLPAECRKIFNINSGDAIIILGDEEKGIALINAGNIKENGGET